MNSKTIKIASYSVAFVLLVIVLSGFVGNGYTSGEARQNDLRYEGTYGLYAEKTDHFNFRWITKEEDMGQYEVLNKHNQVIAKGEGKISRTHRIDLDKEIKAPFTFKFGGKKEGLHEVHIRKEFEQDRTTYKKVDSLYVVGDVHGRYDQLTQLLRKSKIIDKNLNWTGGKAHIVFLGDLFDRGDDVTKVLWFIYELEEKAAQAGGKVHVVLGNHEIMIMSKDLRYISRKERNISIAHGLSYDALFHPVNSYLGSWLRSKVSLLKIGSIVFAHGGLLDLGGMPLDEFNRTAHSYMEDPIYLDLMKKDPDSTVYDPKKWMKMRLFFYDANGPYWFRGYVNSDTLRPELDAMLNQYHSKIHVVAHTTQKTITERYGGKLLTTDLDDAATELLLLVRKGKQYNRFKIDSQGQVSELETTVFPKD